MRCEITAAVPHCLHTTQKLTADHQAGDVGPEVDCGIDGGVCATIIDLPIVMDIICAVIAVCIWALVLYRNRDL